MKRLLVFAYFFPPLGGAGVQRMVKLVKYLPVHGWRATVVTVRNRDYWMDDASLEAEIGPQIDVVRTASVTGLSLLRRLAPRQAGRATTAERGANRGSARGSARGLRRLRRWANWCLIPDSYIGWVPFALGAGERLLRSGRYDALLTTSSPDSAHLIGRRLAQRHRLPWIADFRDPWTRRMSFDPPTRWHRARHIALERSVLSRAARVTVTSEATRRDYLERYPELAAEKIAVVTNGFDEADFAACEGIEPPRTPFEILHAGQLNPERPARPLLVGLAAFLAREPAAREVMRVRFLGPCYETDRAAARELGLASVVAFEPARPHAATVAALCRSHLLLLMEQESERGGLILPGKIFEYLRARRPILALVPPGAAEDLVHELGVGRCCRPSDPAGIADALGFYYNLYRNNELSGTALGPDQLGRFERSALARRMGHLLEATVAATADRGPKPPGDKILPSEPT